MPEAKRLLASYGRRRGRRLRVTKQGLVDTLLPKLSLTLPESGALDLCELFPKAKKFWLEIGFGGGEHLAHQAAQNPDVGIIGCEPYINGIAGLLKHLSSCAKQSEGTGSGAIDPAQPSGSQDFNVRIYQSDARLVIDKLPDASIDRVFILYPDPWPKARHHKRRLVATELLNNLARIMKKDGELRLATDDYDYCTWMLEHLLIYPDFEWTAKSCDDWLNSPKDWLSTRYEQKALASGRVPTYLNFIRI